MRKRMITGAVLAAAMTVTGAGAQEGNTPAATETVVRIQDYPGLGNLLYRVAAAKGFCAKQGIRCQMQPIPTVPLGIQAMLAKNIDVAFASPEVTINAAAKGADFKAIGAGSQRTPLQIVVRPELDVPDGDQDFKPMMQALKGKKIGVPVRGGAGELMFIMMANLAGLKAGDYTFVAVGSPNTSYGALKSKQIDASMTFEPSASICEVIKDCKVVYVGSRATGPKEITGTNGASSLLLVTGEMIARAPATIRAILAAGREAETFIQNPANFGEVVAIASQNSKMNIPHGDEVLAASLKAVLPSLKMGLSRAALKQIAANITTVGQLPQPFDTDTLVYNEAALAGGGQ